MAEQQIALITGANKGIGKEIASQLGKQGMMVLIGARDQLKGVDAVAELMAQGVRARAIRLDVTDPNSIALAAQDIEDDFGRLDVLVNNAGIALDSGPASDLDVETLRRTYETNVFGAFVVTKAMLPLLRKSEAGRIVNLSSGLGSLTQNSDPEWGFAGVKPLAYNSSKAALNMITVIFAAELKETAITPIQASRPPISTSTEAPARWSKEPLLPCAWRRCLRMGRRAGTSTRTG